jgi:hypothetical protein
MPIGCAPQVLRPHSVVGRGAEAESILYQDLSLVKQRFLVVSVSKDPAKLTSLAGARIHDRISCDASLCNARLRKLEKIFNALPGQRNLLMVLDLIYENASSAIGGRSLFCI